MYAITIAAPGGPEVLVWDEVPDPVPGPGEALVEIAATAVNRADVLQRQGRYPPPPGAPLYPGLECSGHIVGFGPPAASPAVDERFGTVDGGDASGKKLSDTTWTVGDEVCALLSGGGYAQRVAVPLGQLLPVPQGVDLIDAAALPEVACTVWSNLMSVARMRAGETLLIHGGGSGIGTFAVQLGAALGVTVITTARSSKHAALRLLGAKVTIDYTTDDFVEVVRTVTSGRGADVILDIVGAGYLARNVEALAVEGRLVVIGMQGGRRAELDLGTLLSKRASIAATSLRARPACQKAAIVAEVHQRVWPLISAGTIKPVIDQRLSMTAADRAHTIVERSSHVGKVVLVN